ncbi:MAG: DUF58 domain-containing protein [Bacteroidetes bacterium]|nr:DUF58 domain-containing protein [Bacteroidota bacterium]
MKSLFLTQRFFYLFGSIVLVFVAGFLFPFVFPAAQTFLVLGAALVLLDILRLYGKNVKIESERILPKVFSLGDSNSVKIRIVNYSGLKLNIILLDELPIQFQERNFEKKLSLAEGQEQKLTYDLKPLKRGVYEFGALNLFIESELGLIQRRIRQEQAAEVPVYPSIVQMKQFELKAFNRIAVHRGIKKIRRIGHSYEFEQIKNYIRGDDYRSINWKASSRRGALMVNQYEDERAQQVYCLIDKSRVMHMPFEGLSLLDYAINTSLAISNIALRKYDRAGLITFSDKMGTALKADSRPTQLNYILRTLYKEKERKGESNYELLYYGIRKMITGRSLLLLFTNFESFYALERVLPVLRKINKLHLLVVLFFENTEIEDFARKEVNTLEEIYHQTIAQKFLTEKRKMVQKLRQYGIQTILTRPEDLSINTINKYLELKSRGMI